MRKSAPTPVPSEHVTKPAPIRVQIVAPNHPHAGEYGYIPVGDGGTIAVIEVCEGVPKMVRVELEDCPHGTDACFVEEGTGHLRIVSKHHTDSNCAVRMMPTGHRRR